MKINDSQITDKKDNNIECNINICSDNDSIDTFQLNMLNEIDKLSVAFLPMISQNNRLTIQVSQKYISLKKQCDIGTLDLTQITGLFESIEKAGVYLNQYLLDASRINLNPDFIFCDLKTNYWHFVYFPFHQLPYGAVPNTHFEQRSLFNWLFCHHRQPIEVNHMSLFKKYLENPDETPTVLLNNLRHQKSDTPSLGFKSKHNSDKLLSLKFFKDSFYKTKIKDNSKIKNNHNAITETLLINRHPYLLNTITHERFNIYYDHTKIGRSKQSHIQIEHDTISLVHATIQCWDNKYFINDESSKNGTFINHKQVNTREELKNGDEIRIGNLSLIFIH